MIGFFLRVLQLLLQLRIIRLQRSDGRVVLLCLRYEFAQGREELSEGGVQLGRYLLGVEGVDVAQQALDVLPLLGSLPA